MSPADERAAAVSAPPSVTLVTAPLARRLASLGYEAMIVCALLLIAGFVTLPLVPPGDGALRVPDAPVRALSLAVMFGASAVYFVMSWSNGRRSLPMKTWHLALVRRDGGGVEPRTAFTRYLCGWIGPALALAGCLALRPFGAAPWGLVLLSFNFLWAFVDPDRQFLHDRLAGTRIITER